MKCERFDKLIYLLLDGRLEKNEESELQEHLSKCEKCAQKLALLKSVEGTAKRIEIEEPQQEYWDTFSSRVREKIMEREEKSPAFRLKKTLQDIFSFSPLKMKVAAGLVSVVLVFIVGKLYVDYRGQEIVPSREVIRSEEQPQLDIMEMEKKEGFPIEEGRKKVRPSLEKSEIGRLPTTADQREGKAIPEKRGESEKEALVKEKKIATQPKVAEEKALPPPAPTLKDQPPVETKRPTEQEFIPLEAEPTGAGAEEGVGEKVAIKMATPREKVQKAEGISQKGKAEQLVTKDISLPPPTRGFRPYSTEEDDTLMQVEELRRTIQVWKAYIEKNPLDSLTNQGYLQVAMAYYLLAKLSQDTTVISEGKKLIETYLDQIAEPALKKRLSDKLEEIKALREK